MSAPSFTSSSELVQKGFLAALALAGLLWSLPVLAVVWLIDPYGISPVKLSVEKFNENKFEAVNLDRQIKPFQVWLQQPHTIILGTSRAHQGFDPAVLDGTNLAPAYNAAIPADRPREMLEALRTYLLLAPSIRHVIVEAFIYSFVTPQPPKVSVPLYDLILSATALYFSEDALLASLRTIDKNRADSIESRITSGGQYIHRRDFLGSFSRQDYINYVMEVSRDVDQMHVDPESLGALLEIIELCKRRDIALTIVLSPNYPWEDYRIVSLGFEVLVKEWYDGLSKLPNVVSFARYNAMTTEEPSDEMRWWYDPVHFRPMLGALILESIASGDERGFPATWAARLNANSVHELFAARSVALEKWVSVHPDFVQDFESARRAAGLGPVER